MRRRSQNCLTLKRYRARDPSISVQNWESAPYAVKYQDRKAKNTILEGDTASVKDVY